MFNFETNISDHPTLTGVKRRHIRAGINIDESAQVITIGGKIYYFRVVNGVEEPIKEIGAQGYIEFPLVASNKFMVDANGTRVHLIPEATDEENNIIPAHFPDGSKGEFNYWMGVYFDLVKTQGVAIAIFDLADQQVLAQDSKGFFNL